MIETKIFEVRDRGTFAPVMAVRLTSTIMAEIYLLRRSGFSISTKYSPQILLVRMGDSTAEFSEFDWTSRTLRTAHRHIRENWDQLETGSVVDVEFILGEAPAQKLSERFTAP